MELFLDGLDCPNCAEKIREAAEKHKAVKKAEMNFMAKKLLLELEDGADNDDVFADIAKLIVSIEPDVKPAFAVKTENRKIEISMNGLASADILEKIRMAVENHYFVEKAEAYYNEKKLSVLLKKGENRKEALVAITRIVKSISPAVSALEIVEKSVPDTVPAGSAEFTLLLENLDCAECGEKIRSYAENMNGVAKAELNFMAKKLRVVLSKTGNEKTVETALRGFINAAEPEVEVIKLAAGESVPVSAANEKPVVTKFVIARFITAALFFLAGFVVRGTMYEYLLFLFSYLIIGGDVLFKAVSNIIRGQVFDECFLMTIASIGAFLIGEYPEGAAVMFLYQLGETFQEYAVHRSRSSIAELMNIRPDSANVKRGDEVVLCSPDEVSVGDIIVVKPGEKIPLDGVITDGSTSLDTVALTGESVPREANEGDEVISGCVNLSGLIEVKVTKEFGESTVSKILELVENSAAKKAKTENFITRFAKIYTPCVVGAAVLIGGVPMLIKGEYLHEWLYRALSFLVVSCPCALVISVPLSFFGGIGGASKRGILVKGGNCFENLANCGAIVFDKTGTLTKGTFEVTEIVPAEMELNEFIKLAAHAESGSNHPAAKAIVSYYDGDIPPVVSAEEIAGMGVKASYGGREVLAGNMNLMEENDVLDAPEVDTAGTVVYIAVNGKYAGYIVISDEIKPDAAEAVASLKKAGIKTIMLTGDREPSARVTAKTLGIDYFEAELLPEGKVEKLEEILSRGDVTAFVGDGINDAPVLMRADVGIAMGALGSDAAIEAADVVLMTDEPSKIMEAVNISKRTKAIVMQNIVFAIGVKILILILTAAGITTMWMAVFGDVGVAMIAILNAMRARTYREPKPKQAAEEDA